MGKRRPREGFKVDENGDEICELPECFRKVFERMRELSPTPRATTPKVRDVDVEVVDAETARLPESGGGHDA